MIKVVGIKFENSGKVYYFSPGNLKIKKNYNVIVETERGIQFGICATGIEEKKEEDIYLPLKEVTRVATKKDVEVNKKNKIASQKALVFSRELVEKENLDMKIYDASYTFDRKKLIFKFIADERVDFRNLAKVLAGKYKTRIELRQIGARDKAKEVSGLGPCGRPLCCSEFLTNFDGISINMAKNQGLALNPSKINGSCGRLLCCLGYEDEMYSYYKKNLPKIGQLVKTKEYTGRVKELSPLTNKFKIKTDDDMLIEIDGNEKWK